MEIFLLRFSVLNLNLRRQTVTYCVNTFLLIYQCSLWHSFFLPRRDLGCSPFFFFANPLSLCHHKACLISSTDHKRRFLLNEDLETMQQPIDYKYYFLISGKTTSLTLSSSCAEYHVCFYVRHKRIAHVGVLSIEAKLCK